MAGRQSDKVRYLRFRLDLTRLLAVFLVTLFAGSAQAAPSADLWKKWTAHDANSKAGIDHGPWDQFLKSYVVVSGDGVNRVAYRKVSATDRRALDGYVDRLAATRISTHNRNQQRAYWINLYNALTVKVILDHYPVKSILKIDISPGLFSSGPWGKKLVNIEGEKVSLDDIEHRILRPIWRDPRIHYTVNCASIGCPNLVPEAFTAANAERLMDRAARDYVNHPRAVKVTPDGLVVSSIYKWFRDDFGDDDAAVIAHLRKYAAPKLAAKLAVATEIDDDEYDWSLNEAARSS